MSFPRGNISVRISAASVRRQIARRILFWSKTLAPRHGGGAKQVPHAATVLASSAGDHPSRCAGKRPTHTRTNEPFHNYDPRKFTSHRPHTSPSAGRAERERGPFRPRRRRPCSAAGHFHRLQPRELLVFF